MRDGTGGLYTIGSLEIRVFGRDHRPAPFNALDPDGDALVDIVRVPTEISATESWVLQEDQSLKPVALISVGALTLAVLRGALPRHHRQEVLTWAALNRAVLIAEWNRLNPDITL